MILDQNMKKTNMKRKTNIPNNSKKVFSGIIFDVYQWEQELYDGSKQTFEMLKRNDTVVVIPITKENKIIITKQSQPRKKEFYAFPGGRCNKNKDITDEAKRELLEETGYSSEEFNLWKSFQNGSKFDWYIHFFIAKRCIKISEKSLDPGEKIKLEFISFEELLKLVYLKQYDPRSLTYEFLRAYYDKKYKEKIRKELFD